MTRPDTTVVVVVFGVFVVLVLVVLVEVIVVVFGSKLFLSTKVATSSSRRYTAISRCGIISKGNSVLAGLKNMSLLAGVPPFFVFLAGAQATPVAQTQVTWRILHTMQIVF